MFLRWGRSSASGIAMLRLARPDLCVRAVANRSSRRVVASPKPYDPRCTRRSARTVLGMDYPSDVLVGALVGASTSRRHDCGRAEPIGQPCRLALTRSGRRQSNRWEQSEAVERAIRLPPLLVRGAPHVLERQFRRHVQTICRRARHVTTTCRDKSFMATYAAFWNVAKT